ncbi:type III restriction enzyme, res subunit [Candidatus Methylomirabilis lanthanidiphila]|uniref:Type III restriction enzyme, res subunit n=1 Tax=Candidatus Methylomirabilis lanthanidiphila TaxID=2211376 RepID=A0A564ZLT2_9BACT|nr:DEAD/DEAH box helicase family protein [Candidatus Methylomirabilis lanthanidiphila]VUZ85622.1 type III restriction enzyme, res subunit [Candidatus Methylomirabilis lanthanidiphila]
MNRHVNAVAGRLSLRAPQRRSLEILDRVTEIVPPKKGVDLTTALAAVQSEFPTVTDFEREFPSLCFALATGVGKTRLMGAFISYLHLAHGLRHFFVLAPNLTIYNKLIADFTPNTPKYVFKGIAEFAAEPPEIITGDNYESGVGVRRSLLPGFEREIHVNIFNISKINSEVRGGRSPRIKRLSEYIGESYFDYLAGLDDLVLLMDESHRYRASAGVRAINELKPVLGLELTATPLIETARGPVRFNNIIYDYPLATAMADGFVKEPAVVTQKNFDPGQFTPAQMEEIKLQDGIRLHENTKVELDTYARQTGQPVVKPFMLIIARDTTHAAQLMQRIRSDEFFSGDYKDKVIQVDSSRTGAEEDEMVQRLLAVESPEEPTEIVIHVNMLKEGWDVTNLYTIVPLRAANARTLIEQSIGRGLRLPYGRRTGVSVVDRLSIVAHDRFQEIIDEANRPDSIIRLTQVVLDPSTDLQKTRTVVIQSNVVEQIEAMADESERRIAQATREVIRRYEHLPGSNHLLRPEIREQIVQEVTEYVRTAQQTLPGVTEQPNIAEVVTKTTDLVVRQTIDIPRILVTPKGEVTSGFHLFTLDCSSIRYQPVERNLLIQHLRTHVQDTLSFGGVSHPEQRLEDYLVRGLVDFDDIAYDEHADLLYDLAGQVVRHLRSYLTEEDTQNVLIYHQKQLAAFVHAQMQAHQWESARGYDVVVSKGFTELKGGACTAKADEPVQDFRQTVEDKGRIAQMVFGGFQQCLYPMQKFQSDAERKLAVILDREVQKWCKPAHGQFHIFYKVGIDHHEYVPDFVAETEHAIYLLEAKARNEMTDADVLAKQEAAMTWCGYATTHALSNGGKPWTYLLIPHDAIAGNMTLGGLVAQFATAL